MAAGYWFVPFTHERENFLSRLSSNGFSLIFVDSVKSPTEMKFDPIGLRLLVAVAQVRSSRLL